MGAVDFFEYFFNSKADYLTYLPGRCGVVLSAPHSGSIRPYNFPSRQYGKMGQDQYTKKIIQYLAKNLEKRPFYIYSDLHRSRLDLDRGIKEGAQGNPKAQAIWRTWNKVLTEYTRSASERYGRALYVDIHSQSNTDSFHLGYNISAENYRKILLEGTGSVKSTMSGLEEDEFELLFGEGSFSDSLMRRGMKVYLPEDDKEYFNGGHNVQTFSRPGVGGIQIEIPTSACKEDLLDVELALKYSIEHFMERFLYARNTNPMGKQ